MKLANLKFDSDRDQFTGEITGTLVSLGTTALQNVNGTRYFVATVTIEGRQVSALAFEKNVEKGLVIGTDYLCNVTITKNRPDEPIISVSSLTTAPRANSAMFDFDFNAELAKATSVVGQEEVAEITV